MKIPIVLFSACLPIGYLFSLPFCFKALSFSLFCAYFHPHFCSFPFQQRKKVNTMAGTSHEQRVLSYLYEQVVIISILHLHPDLPPLIYISPYYVYLFLLRFLLFCGLFHGFSFWVFGLWCWKVVMIYGWERHIYQTVVQYLIFFFFVLMNFAAEDMVLH